VLLLERDTAIPPVGAGPVRDTVPAELEPPTTDVGFRVTLSRVGTATVSVAVFVVAPRVALMVAVIFAVTAVVAVVNVADVLPEATVTDAGTVTPLATSLLERVTTVPPAGAGPDRVTVPDELAPPVTDVGFRAALSSVGAVTVSAAVLVVEPRTALIVAETLAVTPVVEVVKVAVVLPEATVTDAGTVTPLAVLLLERLTAVPPVGAGLESVTVPVELVPPITEVGLRVTPLRTGAVTAIVVVFVVLPSVALIVAEILAVTGVVAVVNVPDVFPTATVTDDGTVTPLATSLLDRLTTVPPVGAAADNVTVPVELVPPATEVGLSERAVKLAAAKAGEPQVVSRATDAQTRMKLSTE